MSGKEKRQRKSSSDSSGQKSPPLCQPSKMVKQCSVRGKDTSELSEVKQMLLDIKKEHASNNEMLFEKLSELKGTMLTVTQEKIDEMKAFVTTEIKKMAEKIDDIEHRMSNIEKRGLVAESVRDQCASGDDTRVRDLQYKLLDLEARAKQSNLVIYNIPEEEGENLEEVFQRFVREKLCIERPVHVQSVYRVGRQVNRDNNNKHRLMIVTLCNGADVKLCLQNSDKLKGSKIGLSKDFPPQIRQARKTLEAKRRTAVQEGKKAVIAFPAKLIVDGELVADAMPGWPAGREGRGGRKEK